VARAKLSRREHVARAGLLGALVVLSPVALQGIETAIIIAIAQVAIQAAAIAASILLRPKPQGQHTEGPRLEDRVVTISSYGQPIPIQLGGVVRVSGGIIWSRDIREVKTHHSTSAGKGGGGGSISSNTYSYFGDFAASFGEGVAAVDGLLKVWCNGKLIIDNTKLGDAVKKYPDLQVRFYVGDATQLADTLISSVEGLANTPAYRGQCYAVFENLPLADFGNHLPNLEALVAYAADANKTSTIIDAPGGGGLINAAFLLDRNRNTIYWIQNPGQPTTVGIDAQAVVRYNPVLNDVEYKRFELDVSSNDIVSELELDDLGFLYALTRVGSTGYRVHRLDALTGSTLLVSGDSTVTTGTYRPDQSVYISKAAAGGIGSYIVTSTLASSGQTGHGRLSLINLNANGDVSGAGDISIQGVRDLPEMQPGLGMVRSICADKNGDVWVIARTDAGIVFLYQLEIVASTPTTASLQIKATHNLTTLTTMTDAHHIGYDVASHALLIGKINNSGTPALRQVRKFDLATLTTLWTLSEDHASVTVGDLIREATGGLVLSNRFLFKYAAQAGLLFTTDVSSQTDGIVYRIRVSDGVLERIYDLGDYWTSPGLCDQVLYDSLTNLCYAVRNTTPFDLRRIAFDRVTQLTTTLQSGVEALCARAGLDVATQVDASGLASAQLRGYPIANLPSTVRALIEPLALAYFFDGVESDFKIKFILRGGAVAATIAEDDLGAFSETSPPESLQRLQEEIGQDVELPEQVDVRFIDVNKDLQVGDQYEKRIGAPAPTTLSRKKVTLDVPIVFNATEARSIVERFIYQEWVKKYGFKYQTLPKHLRLDPSDVVNISKDGLTFGARLAEVVLGGGLVVEHIAESEDSETYSFTNQTGDDNLFVGDTFGSVGASELFLFDYLLRDADDPTAGLALPLYMGSAPQQETAFWRGASMQKSVDGGLTFAQIEVARDDSTWGRTVVTGALGLTPAFALAPYFDWMVWDRITTFRVRIASGSARLASVAEAALLADANLNVLMVGQELIRFATVVDNGDGSFDFSTLIRGRRGTGWAAENGHRGGTLVVLLDQDALSYSGQPPAERDVVRHWRAVTLAGLLDNSAQRGQAISGLGLKPYRVRHIESTRDGANLIVVSWQRQARVGGELDWNDGVTDPPIGETAENYRIDFINPSFRGVSTGITATTLTQTGAGWTVDEHAGRYVLHRHNPHHGSSATPTDFTRGRVHLRRVLSNTATVLTLADASWAFTPTVGDSYFIQDLVAPVVLRTSTQTLKTFVYSSAQQVTDGFTAGQGILAMVAQLSSAVGLGVVSWEPVFGT
jgi:hypothetical protein